MKHSGKGANTLHWECEKEDERRRQIGSEADSEQGRTGIRRRHKEREAQRQTKKQIGRE